MIFVISQMPPLVHWDREGEFDIGKSEVCRWLMGQPDFMNWAVQKARDLGAIEYRDGKWVGVNYGAGPAAVSVAAASGDPVANNESSPGPDGKPVVSEESQ